MSSRRPLSFATVGVCSIMTAALVFGSATAATAATSTPAAATPHLVTLDEALAALPSAKQLPGGVQLVAKIELPTQAQISPCPELLFNSFADLNVKAGTAGAVYEPAHHQIPPEKTATWALSAVIFHTAKLAKAAEARLLELEKICPKNLGGQGLPVEISRTHAGKYTVDGWTGYRSVDQASSLNLIDGPEPEGIRLTQVFLVKGNVLLSLSEQGGLQPGTAARQEAWRKTVTKLLYTSFDALGS